ncbi:N-lysine methyltransferase KMT5A-A-like [Mya arenaria]|uniref:N-lysine methyltransferase KMT5A-A-like n=1 Tax=Mya arenaria TaxID=6604 RepID=UPI0022E954BE|nr:N-lysine methyltransferase KMT5A-A-like [Mya arenaria]
MFQSYKIIIGKITGIIFLPLLKFVKNVHLYCRMAGYLSRGKRAVEEALGVTRKPRLSPVQSARKWCGKATDQEGLERHFVSENIGFGVFATKPFEKGDFLLEYCGTHCTPEEADRTNHNYLFGFKYAGKYIWIDAFQTDRLGRFVNDAKENTIGCNSKQKLLFFEGVPHICLFASKTIHIGDEIRYDYGDDSGNLFWRNQLLSTMTIQMVLMMMMMILLMLKKPKQR